MPIFSFPLDPSRAASPKPRVHSWRRQLIGGILPLLLMVMPLGGCGSSAVSVSGGVVKVIAAENFWGSLATQIGGTHANVTSIVTDPNADPHEYESNTNNARAFAQANYVMVNGAGYDTWAQKLLDANPTAGRKVLNIANLLGKKEGDNPHFWYSPDYVEQVADRITNDLKALDPADSAYFTQQRAALDTALQPYHQRISAIKQKFVGQKIGATESLFAYMAQALGLELISPPAFMNAVSEGTDPPIASVREFQQQINTKEIAVLVYNLQTATAVTTNIKQLAAQHNIPVVGISETIQPSDASFQDWQYAQLVALENALKAGAVSR